MPFCSTYSPTIASADPDDRVKKARGLIFALSVQSLFRKLNIFYKICLCRYLSTLEYVGLG